MQFAAEYVTQAIDQQMPQVTKALVLKWLDAYDQDIDEAIEGQ